MDFEALANAHKDAVYRQMIRACGNHQDAEDVLIEALLSAYRNLHQLQHADAFRAWLIQIAKRVCWRLKDRQALSPLLQMSILEDGGQDLRATDPLPDEAFAQRQMKSLFQQALESIPKGYRDVYQLREIEQQSGSKAAETLNLSIPAMKSRLRRARMLLRQHLDHAFVIR